MTPIPTQDALEKRCRRRATLQGRSFQRVTLNKGLRRYHVDNDMNGYVSLPVLANIFGAWHSDAECEAYIRAMNAHARLGQHNGGDAA